MIRVNVNREGFGRLREKTAALQITHADFRGPVLVELGKLHRKQELRIFATEGGAGAAGRWPALNPGYAKVKRKAGFGRKILVRTGDMKRRFTMPSNPSYYQDFIPSGSGGTLRFGARSKIGAAHKAGLRNLPVRDMITKTAEQIAQFRLALVLWYAKRVQQVERHFGTASRPR